MQRDTASHPLQPAVTSRFLTRQRLFEACAYLLMIALSYVAVVGAMPLASLVGDQNDYLKQAQQINELGLGVYVPDTSAYGYPLFMAGMVQLARVTGLTATEVIMLAQFAIHTVSSLIGLAILTGLKPDVTFPVRLVTFGLIQGNPVLLGLTRLFLTDSIAILPITVLLWCVVYQPRGKYLIAGTALGTAMVLRPFHQIWFISWIAGCVVLAFLRGRRMRYSIRWMVRQALPQSWQQGFLIAAHFLVPLLGVLAPQVITVYHAENRIALSGSEAGIWAQRHIGLGLFVYKYETFVGDGSRGQPVQYMNDESILNIEAALKKDTPDTQSIVVSELPALVLPLPILKLAGIFQNYEWSVYRDSLENRLNLVVVWGGIIFYLFLYSLQSFLRHWRYRPQRSEALLNAPLVLFLAMSAYVFLYVLFTAPEGRFIAPIIPGLVALGVYRILLENSRQRQLVTAITATIVYGFTFIVLANSINLVVRD